MTDLTDTAAQLLIEHNILAPRTLVDQQVEFRGNRRRNRNVIVEIGEDEGLFVKQLDTLGVAIDHSFSAETHFYEFCRAYDPGRELGRFLPDFVGYIERDNLLILRLIRNSRPLWRFFVDHPRGQSPAIPAAVGQALSALHRFGRTWLAMDHEALPPRRVPWMLYAHRAGPEILARLSAANAELLNIIFEYPALEQALDAAAGDWSQETVIHGDVRCDNILLPQPQDETDPTLIKVVDWEFIQIGDPAWDIAGLLQDCLVFWLKSVPTELLLKRPKMHMGLLISHAEYPLQTLHAFLGEFVRSYIGAATMSPDAPHSLLRRAVRLSALRLLQSAYEQGQSCSGMPFLGAMMVQLSLNILANPEVACSGLYGLSL